MSNIVIRAHRRPILIAMIADAEARGLGHLVPRMVSGELLVVEYLRMTGQVAS